MDKAQILTIVFSSLVSIVVGLGTATATYFGAREQFRAEIARYSPEEKKAKGITEQSPYGFIYVGDTSRLYRIKNLGRSLIIIIDKDPKTIATDEDLKKGLYIDLAKNESIDVEGQIIAFKPKPGKKGEDISTTVSFKLIDFK